MTKPVGMCHCLHYYCLYASDKAHLVSFFLCFILWQSRQRAGLPFRNTTPAHFKSNLAYVVTILGMNLKHWTLSARHKKVLP